MFQYFQVRFHLKKAEQQAQEPPLLRKIQGQMQELRTQHNQAMQQVNYTTVFQGIFHIFPDVHKT